MISNLKCTECDKKIGDRRYHLGYTDCLDCSDTEKYSATETTQSYLKYSNINAWKEEFLRKTIDNVYYGLKKNHFMALNVADVKSYETFEKDTKTIAEEVGFKLVDTFDLRLSSQQAEYKSEPIFIFKK